MDSLQEVKAFARSMTGLPCWYVSTGGAAGTTFQLALGEKVRRDVVIQNTAHPAEFNEFEGEANLLVWCTWRLDGPDGPLTSSDDTQENVGRQLDRLRGAKVLAAAVVNPSFDLTVRFSNRLKLLIFCNHVPGEPTFNGNWELWRTDDVLLVGPGSRFQLGSRDVVATQPVPDHR